MIILSFTFLSINRVKAWETEKSLFKSDLQNENISYKSRIQNAEIYYEEKKYDKALKMINQISETDQINILKAHIYIKIGNNQEALTSINKINDTTTKEYKEILRYLLNIPKKGNLTHVEELTKLIRLKEYTKAINIINAIKYPSTEIKRLKTSILIEQGFHNEALEVLLSIKNSYNNDIYYLIDLSVTYYNTNNNKLSLKTINKAYSIEPTNKLVLQTITSINYNLKQYENTRYYLKKGMEIDKLNPIYIYILEKLANEK